MVFIVGQFFLGLTMACLMHVLVLLFHLPLVHVSLCVCCSFTSPLCRRAKKAKKNLRGGPGWGVNGESRAPGPGPLMEVTRAEKQRDQILAANLAEPTP